MIQVEGELDWVRSSIEELRLKAAESKSIMDQLQKKSEQQTKLMEAISRGFRRNGDEDGGENSVGQKESEKPKASVSLKPLEGIALEEFRQSLKKVELPMFNGEDPAGWITRAEIYFRVHETSEEVKVNLAQLCMENETIYFFNALLSDYDELTWDDLKHELLEHYGGIGEGSVFEQLTSLQQTGGVEEYIKKFECLTSQIPRLHDEQYFAYFIHGLREEIRSRMRSLNVVSPMSHGRMMNAAKAIKLELSSHGRNWSEKKETRGSGGSYLGFRISSNVLARNNPRSFGGQGVVMGLAQMHQLTLEKKNRNWPRDRGTKHLAYQDLMERCRKGLCFKCGESYGAFHQCPMKQLRVILVGYMQAEFDGECSAMRLLSSQVEQIGDSRTMKMRGKVFDVPLFILVHSGASHNFISRKLVEAMGWKWEETRSMRILLGDGHKTLTCGVCHRLTVEVDACRFVVDTCLFDLEDIDLILGMAWLSS